MLIFVWITGTTNAYFSPTALTIPTTPLAPITPISTFMLSRNPLLIVK